MVKTISLIVLIKCRLISYKSDIVFSPPNLKFALSHNIMNSKEFFAEVAARAELNSKEAQTLSGTLALAIADNLNEGDTFSVQGFGNFEIKKKMERIMVNPTTKQRHLVPPKLAIAFKTSTVLKDKLQ